MPSAQKRKAPAPTEKPPPGPRAILNDQKRVIASKLASGEYDTVDKVFVDNGDHYIWDVFKLVRDRETLQMLDFAHCRKCKTVLSFKEANGCKALGLHALACTGTSSKLSRGDLTTLVHPPHWAEIEMTKSQAHLSARNMLPPHIFESKGIVQFVQKGIDIGNACGRVDASKLLAGPTTVSAHIRAEAQVARRDVALEIREAIENYGCAAACDNWTEDHTKDHYTNLKTFNITDGWLLICRTLFTNTILQGLPSTGINLRNALVRTFSEMGIGVDLFRQLFFVSDNGPDVVKALEHLARIYCMAHGLNIVTRTTLSVKYAEIVQVALRRTPEAQLLIDECNDWVRDVRKIMPPKPKTGGKERENLLKRLRCSNMGSESHVPPLKSFSECRDSVRITLAYASGSQT